SDDPQQPWFGNANNLTMLFITLIAVGLVFIFMTVNYISSRFGPKVSQISTILKFLPILIIVVFGIAFGIKNGGGLWTGDYSHITGVDQEQKGQFNILGMLNSIPAIMFAFDGFLIVGNIAAKVENPRKNVSRSIVIAMIIIIILNLAITVSCITIGCGDPFLAFGQAFGEGTILAAVFTYTMAALIAFSAVACVNAFTMAGVDSLQDCIKDESIMFANYFKRIRTSDDCKLAATLYYSAFLAIVGIALSIPSCILNTDQIWDGTTVVSVIIFFALYGIVICGGLMNRKTYRCEVAMKSKMFVPSGVIGAIGCLFIAGYSLFYTYLGNMFIGSHATDTFQAWGLSFTPDAVTGNYFQGYVAAIIFWVLFVVICLYPFLNDLGIMLTNKDYGHALMWQREDAQPVIIINQEAPKLPPLALSKKGKKKTVA
ncbi:MAG: APC family permease, partial [Malacoplasma sp.]|nr:APC family permease [Malacoplasma sp.]